MYTWGRKGERWARAKHLQELHPSAPPLDSSTAHCSVAAVARRVRQRDTQIEDLHDDISKAMREPGGLARNAGRMEPWQKR